MACEVGLYLAWGTVWIYLFVLVALPSSILPFYVSAVGWGGLNQLGGGVGEAAITALWALAPPIQVVLVRMAVRSRSRSTSG